MYTEEQFEKMKRSNPLGGEYHNPLGSFNKKKRKNETDNAYNERMHATKHLM